MALTTELNGLLQTQGVTAAQAQQAFGLPPDSTDWMKNVGVKFASNPTQTSVAVGGTATPVTGAAAPAVTPTNAAASGYNATNASASLMDAQAGHAGTTTGQASTFTPGTNATVQGQIAGITAKDSPLMQQAETKALQDASTRGLMNSSMAVQGGQAALYAAALPIAQQDASMYASTGQFNASQEQQMEMANTAAKNNTSQFNATADNQRSSQNAQLGTQVNLANAAATNAASEFNATTATDVSKFNASNLLQAGIVNQQQANAMAQFMTDQTNRAMLTQLQQDNDVAKFNASESNALQKLGIDSDTKVQLANIEASYKTLMQTSASASDIYKTLITQIAAIQSSKDMDATSKTQAINNLMGVTNASLGLIGDVANLNLPELDLGGAAPAGAAPVAGIAPAPVANPQAVPVQDVNQTIPGGIA